jgi:transcriptional regulator with XRE-family HTH domain
MGRFSRSAGQVLRETRGHLGMSLYDVARVSEGRFKPSALGGYERGERTLSIDRFCELARIYGVPPDELLGEVLAKLDPAGREEVVIDLTRIGLVEAPERGRVAEFVHRIKALRRDYLTDVLTLRSGDVAALALASGRRTDEVMSVLRPALRGNGGGPTSEGS